MQMSDKFEVFFFIVAVKTSKREQPKTVYLTVKLNVIIPKSSTPYKWATLLQEKNKDSWVSTTFEHVGASQSTWTVDEIFPVNITLKHKVIGND